jgi:hypothetical protein
MATMQENSSLVAAEPANAYDPAADPFAQVRTGRLL